MNIAFFGSSLLSSYWNGAATYYRGIIRALHERGHQITFYEPDAYDRQQHRDIDPPSWARSVIYAAREDDIYRQIEAAAAADLIVKASGVGVFDDLLEAGVLGLRSSRRTVAFWDVDAPATLERMAAQPSDPLRRLIPDFDMVLTYGGGAPVINAYYELGAKSCTPIYNGLDPSSHHPVVKKPEFASDLSFLGNRLPDRESRVEEFFLRAAELTPSRSFLLGGSGWDDKPLPTNVRHLGHVPTTDHNAFNCSAHMTLNISRESMARFGFSPATRVFEAAGAAACLITDYWHGIEEFFDPGSEILVARTGRDVARLVAETTPEEAKAIGQRALLRAHGEHTYAHRADQFESLFDGALAK